MGPTMNDSRSDDRELRRLRRDFRTLTDQVLLFLDALDAAAMKDLTVPRPASERLAKLANALDLANDQARYFGLGLDYRRDNKPLAVARLKRKATKGNTP